MDLGSSSMSHIQIEKNLPQIEGLNEFVNDKGWNQVSQAISSLLEEMAVFCMLFSYDSYHNLDKMEAHFHQSILQMYSPVGIEAVPETDA